MKILTFAEQREGKFKKSTFEVINTAKGIARQLNAELTTLLISSSGENLAQGLGTYGVTRVLLVDDPQLDSYSTTAYAKTVAEVAVQEHASVLFMPASQMGKDLAPRVAAKLSAGLAPDCVSLKVENGEIIATRPIYSGKAFIDVKINSPVKIFTLRPNVFSGTAGDSNIPKIEKVNVNLSANDFAARATGIKVAEGRPDVTEANIIVSGGRGMKGSEHFQLLEKLAELLGASVGASRAVVDAGWRPHEEQIGQTGKTVAPTLYMAFGISGAIQHLAGMSSSKYIVAVNKDKDAPIFQVADYGIVGDVFEILPQLVEEIKQLLSH